LFVVASTEREFADLHPFDGRGARRSAEFDGDRSLLDGNRVGHGADLQGHVDFQIVTDVEDDAGAGFALEARDLYPDRVGSTGINGAE
jgi:hypothetical protein